MRLIMKYKDVSGLGEAARDLVNFSRRTRALDRLLHDGTRAGVVLVTLGEPAVIAETNRLAGALHDTRVAILGVIRNRIKVDSGDAAWVHLDEGFWRTESSPPIFAASLHEPPLVGVSVIRDWCQSWQERD